MKTTSDIKPVIQFHEVSFAYPQNLKKKVVNQLNFSLNRGEFLTMIGINGSGKSTVGKILSGLLLNFSGSVTLFGQKLTINTYQDLLRHIGFVFQDPESQFIGENVLQDLAFGLENLQVNPNDMPELIREMIDQFQLREILTKAPVNLSGGDKQKVAIASILITKPKIIIFDEPTSMLDPQTQTAIFAIIDRLRKDPNITVIEITHDMERIVKSDKVLLLKEGKQNFFGAPKTLLTDHHQLFLNQSGLILPFIFRLSLELYQAKLISKLYFEEQDLLEALWKKNSK